MDTANNYLPYTKLLEEFRQKVSFLKSEYHLEQQEIATKIAEHPTNFSRYLVGNKGPSLKKLTKIINALNRNYNQQLRALNPNENNQLHLTDEIPEDAHIEKITQVLLRINNDLRSLTELILQFVSSLR